MCVLYVFADSLVLMLPMKKSTWLLWTSAAGRTGMLVLDDAVKGVHALYTVVSLCPRKCGVGLKPHCHCVLGYSFAAKKKRHTIRQVCVYVILERLFLITLSQSTIRIIDNIIAYTLASGALALCVS